MLHHKKSIVITVLGAAVIFIATTAMKTPTVKQEPGFKNLKVLPKDISKEDLDKVMDQWRDALGVRCGFCHARDAATNKTDFASDAKPEKEITRKMMEMTKQINEKYFKDMGEKHDGPAMAAVACYTCHNGKAQPATMAPPHTPGQGGPGMPQGGMPPAGGGGGTPPPAGTPPPTR